MLTCSQPVEAYTGKKLYNLEVGTILKFTFEFSDYVAMMRQAALPIHNYMSTSANQELLSTALARRWNIISQIQFNGLNTGKVMKLLKVKATPRSLNQFYCSLKDNTEFPAMGEYEITLSNFNKFYDAYKKYRVYFEYVYVFLSQYCDPSCIVSYKGGEETIYRSYSERSW
jgi:hypothetical protein